MNNAHAVRPVPKTRSLYYTTEAELVEAMLRGEVEAWRHFVGRFEPKMRASIAKELERLVDDASASDAVDDIVGDYNLRLVERDMRTLRAWVGFARNVPLAAWLWMIAQALTKNYVRDEKRARGEELDDVGAEAEERDRSWTTSEAQIATPKLKLFDSPTGLTFLWFGEREVLVYDADGREVFNLPVAAKAQRIRKSDVIRSIRRLIGRIQRSRAKRA